MVVHHGNRLLSLSKCNVGGIHAASTWEYWLVKENHVLHHCIVQLNNGRIFDNGRLAGIMQATYPQVVRSVVRFLTQRRPAMS